MLSCIVVVPSDWNAAEGSVDGRGKQGRGRGIKRLSNEWLENLFLLMVRRTTQTRFWEDAPLHRATAT